MGTHIIHEGIVSESLEPLCYAKLTGTYIVSRRCDRQERIAMLFQHSVKNID